MADYSLPPILPVVARGEVSTVWRIGRGGSGEGELDFPTDLVYTPYGHLAVADYGNKRVQLYDSRGVPAGWIRHGRPFCVAVIPGSCRIIVTDQENVCAAEFTLSGELVARYGHQVLREPSGIAAFRDDRWVLTDTKTHSAHVFDTDGNVITSFGGRGQENAQFNWPAYVTTDSKDRVIISDTNNHCIKIFDRHGKFLSKVTNAGEEKIKFLFPKGVCVDDMDNIYLAEWGHDRIIMMDANFRYIRTILGYGNAQCPGMSNPLAIAVDPNGCIAVTSRSPEPNVYLMKYNALVTSSYPDNDVTCGTTTSECLELFS